MLSVDNIFGNSLDDIYLVQYSDEHQHGYTWIERVVLKFGRAYFVASVKPDTDEIETHILDQFEPGNNTIKVSTRPENTLFHLLGGQPAWVWTMTNNRGYADGIQFQIGSGANNLVQFVAIASRLQINILNSPENKSE